MTKMSDLKVVFDRLFPICRSITGLGIRSSLKIMADYMPLQIESVATGAKVLDWVVPQEWELHRATLIGPDGETVLDSANSNIHCLNFSEPFSGNIDLEELQSHIYSNSDLPDAIPYVTSYYVPRWGLCMTQQQRDSLKPGQYQVQIETSKYDGVLNFGVCELTGETENLILLTSYLCHPSLANNELSGPLALLRIWEKLSSLKSRKFTYRFLLIPETIGSISYLALYGEELRKRLYGGLVLTCMGGPAGTVSYKKSRQDWTGLPSPIDRLVSHLAHTMTDQFSVRPFTPTGGSDERQFCSQGFDLPMAQAARTTYGDYKEYHTSADDLEFMTISAVEKSADQVFATLSALEVSDAHYINTAPFGEPHFGRRGLYPTVNGPMTGLLSNDTMQDGRKTLERLLCLLSLADGSRSLIEIAEHVGCSVLDLAPIARHLVNEGLLKESPK